MRGARELTAAVPAAKIALGRLAYLLGETPAAEAEAALATVSALGGADTWADLYERADAAADGERDIFLHAVELAQRTLELAPQAVSVQAAVEYLRALEGRFGPEEGSLERQRDNVLQQINVLALVAGRWGDLAQQFSQFKSGFRTQYRKFHRDYRDAVVRLGAEHGEMDRDLRVLERLDRLEQLGGAQAPALRGRWQGLGIGLQPCPVDDVNAVSVENAPQCERCGVRYDAELPERDVRALAGDLRAAVLEKANTLRSLLFRRLQRNTELDVHDLAAAVEIGGEGLIDLFAGSDEAVAIAARLLATARVGHSNALRRLREEFPAYSADTLDQIVNRFRELLADDLTKAEANAELRLD
jgi:hypothetical protein